MQNQTGIDIKSPDVLPPKDKVTPENFLSDHRPVFANVAMENESPLRVMSWNVQGPSGCYGNIYASIIKNVSTSLIENPELELELSVEEKKIVRHILVKYPDFLNEGVENHKKAKKVQYLIEDYYYSQRMQKQALLIPKEELDVIFLQEATPETVEVYLEALGEAWTAVHEPLEKDSNVNVTFIRKERFAKPKADEEKYTVTEKFEPYDENKFKYCQSLVLKTKQGNQIELINYWGLDTYNDPEEEKSKLIKLEELMLNPLQAGTVKRILGGDTNLPLGTGPDDEKTCIGFENPSQYDVILSSTGDGSIENETLIKSSYQREFHPDKQENEIEKQKRTKISQQISQIQETEKLKNGMYRAIQQQISRIQETQTWFWRFFYADGAAKIAVLEKLNQSILKSNTKEELGNNIQIFLSSPFSSTEPTITNLDILKARRFLGKSEANQVIQEIQTQANQFKK